MMIPPEITEFYTMPGGQSLLVEGKPGTGKTIFALQVLEEMSNSDIGFYLSTRVPDESLYKQFPWLKDKERRERIIDASRDFLKIDHPVKEQIKAKDNKKIKAARAFLKVAHGETTPKRIDRSSLSRLLEQIDIPEIERIYDRIEARLPKKCFLAIDSVNGLSDRHHIKPAELVKALQKDLVESSNTNLLLVLEQTGNSNVNYLADGVVTLELGCIEGRAVRKIGLKKLKGTRIIQKKYLFTLEGGRFRSFEPFRTAFPSEPARPEPIPDPSPSIISSGSTDFDKILGGGYRKGGFHLFEVSQGIGDAYYSILLPIFINHINLGRGLLALSSEGTSTENEKRLIYPFTGEEQFNKRFLGFETRVKQATVYIRQLTGNAKYDMELLNKVEQEMVRKFGEPVLSLIGLDTMEYNYGIEETEKIVGPLFSRVKTTQNVALGVVKHGQKLTKKVGHMATTHWKFKNVDNALTMYGIIPTTGMYNVEMNVLDGYPELKLTPIV